MDKEHKKQVKGSHFYSLLNVKPKGRVGSRANISDESTDVFIDITNGFICYSINNNDYPRCCSSYLCIYPYNFHQKIF